jgi:hypothetical protein
LSLLLLLEEEESGGLNDSKKREAKREWKGTYAKMTVLKREGKGGWGGKPDDVGTTRV